MLAGAEKAGQDFGIKIGKFGPTSETNIDEQVRRNAPALSYLAPLLLGESVTEGTATCWLKKEATPSSSTNLCSRCPPTRSTPRSRCPWPARC
jgi:hypothetical protein